ncbi:hypothetical protein LPY66_04805 [Dehalobacter sp. DCM]|uniref:hypothetical protein n=1 Tax=Dehalobacter sp. DCM TaxID=2907827 RepID=UPI003081364E|nr:hypothetical protein LPY66_04805 [Dehalobacter sp. DCM]
MILEILFALSLRFFFFDFVLFKRIRNYLKGKGYFFRKLFGCPFCQGFWCGLGIFLLHRTIHFSWSWLLDFLAFGFICAYLSLILAVTIHPLLQKYERDSGIPLK